MSMIKGILLDLDDTLYDYDSCNNAATSRSLEALSKQLQIPHGKVKDEFYAARNYVKVFLEGTASSHSRLLYFKRLIEVLEGRTNPELSIKIHDLFWKEYFKKMRLSKSAKEFLELCHFKKKKVAIITNLTAEIQLKKIKRLGISKYIDFVITSEEAGKEKPAPYAAYIALHMLSCKPKEVIMIGDDGKKDIICAKSLGIQAYKSFDAVPLNLL